MNKRDFEGSGKLIWPYWLSRLVVVVAVVAIGCGVLVDAKAAELPIVSASGQASAQACNDSLQKILYEKTFDSLIGASKKYKISVWYDGLKGKDRLRVCDDAENVIFLTDTPDATGASIEIDPIYSEGEFKFLLLSLDFEPSPPLANSYYVIYSMASRNEYLVGWSAVKPKLFLDDDNHNTKVIVVYQDIFGVSDANAPMWPIFFTVTNDVIKLDDPIRHIKQLGIMKNDTKEYIAELQGKCEKFQSDSSFSCPFNREIDSLTKQFSAIDALLNKADAAD